MNAARVLRYARRRAGLSQRALAEKSGVPQPAIARIESGGVSPRIDTLSKLLAAAAATLDVTPRLGEGVDRTLIRASLQMSPERRVTGAGHGARNLATFLSEVHRGTRR